MSDYVEIFEMGPRDGMQNEKRLIPTADKIALIDGHWQPRVVAEHQHPRGAQFRQRLGVHDAVERGIKDGSWVWVTGAENSSKAKVKALVTDRVGKGVAWNALRDAYLDPANFGDLDDDGDIDHTIEAVRRAAQRLQRLAKLAKKVGDSPAPKAPAKPANAPATAAKAQAPAQPAKPASAPAWAPNAPQ